MLTLARKFSVLGYFEPVELNCGNWIREVPTPGPGGAQLPEAVQSKLEYLKKLQAYD